MTRVGGPRPREKERGPRAVDRRAWTGRPSCSPASADEQLQPPPTHCARGLSGGVIGHGLIVPQGVTAGHGTFTPSLKWQGMAFLKRVASGASRMEPTGLAPKSGAVEKDRADGGDLNRSE